MTAERVRVAPPTYLLLDGKAVVFGADGRSDFDALHSRKHDGEAQFYAFDMLAGDGDDYRKLPLSMRKTNLARLIGTPKRGLHWRTWTSSSSPSCPSASSC